MSSLKPLVETLVGLTAADSEAVQVEERNDRGVRVFTVNVAPNDVGRIIGKEGRVIACIRSVVSAAGAKYQQKTVVKIATPD